MQLIDFIKWGFKDPVNFIIVVGCFKMMFDLGMDGGRYANKALDSFAGWFLAILYFLWDCFASYSKQRWNRFRNPKAQTLAEFQDFMIRAFRKHDPKLSHEEARVLTRDTYESQLPDRGPIAGRITFGDKDFLWTREGAEELVREEISHWRE